MKGRKLFTTAFAVALGVIVTGSALASHGTAYWYNVTVPSFNGSATTNNVTKQYAENATVDSYSIGADYQMDVRVEKLDNTSVSSWYRINDNTKINFPTTATAGQQHHARFSNDWNTPVSVQAYGYWSPDTF